MAGAALLLAMLAVPTVLHTFFGAAAIRVKFEIFDQQHLRALRCSILNPPIENKFLRRVGVRRESATVLVAFQVMEGGTDKTIVDQVVPILNAVGGPAPSNRLCNPPFLALTHYYFWKKEKNSMSVRDTLTLPTEGRSPSAHPFRSSPTTGL